MALLPRVARHALIGVLAATAIAVVLLVASTGSTTTEAHAGQYAMFGGPGTGYVDVPDDPALNPTSAITLESWVFLTSYDSSPSGDCPSVIGKGYLTSYWLGICGDVASVYPKGGVGSYFDGTGVVPLNQWTHLAATYDGTTTSIYINGVLDATTGAYTGPIGTNADDLYIGADPDYLYSPVGAVDEVRLWNVARTGPEIASTMNTTITTPQTGLVAAWNMEGDGADALHNHNGTPAGDITFSGVPLGSETASPTETPVPTDTTPVTASPSPAPIFIGKGDTDCSGTYDANDIMPYLKWFAGLSGHPEPCQTGPVSLPQDIAPFGQWFDVNQTSGYIEIPDDDALNPPTAMTVEMLVNPYSYQDYAGGTSCVSLLGKGYTTSWWLGLCNGQIRFYSRGNGSARTGDFALPLRQWSHIAVTVDATTMTMYVNGELDTQFTNLDGPPTANDEPLRIASDVDWDVRPLAAIDEVRIWNVARSQAEIQSTMGGPITLPQTGLAAAYQLSGNLSDSAGVKDGTAVGSVILDDSSLPPVQWLDVNCDGYTDLYDALVLMADLSGIHNLRAGCEPFGAGEY